LICTSVKYPSAPVTGCHTNVTDRGHSDKDAPSAGDVSTGIARALDDVTGVEEPTGKLVGVVVGARVGSCVGVEKFISFDMFISFENEQPVHPETMMANTTRLMIGNSFLNVNMLDHTLSFLYFLLML
jgi:hypothetical protein